MGGSPLAALTLALSLALEPGLQPSSSVSCCWQWLAFSIGGQAKGAGGVPPVPQGAVQA